MSRAGCKERKAIRKKNATERQEVSNKRTPQEQLERLDWKLGDGKGAAKERAKLLKRMEDAKKETENENA